MSTRKRSDLFREYARVIDMCEGTEVTAKQCVRIHQQGHGDTFMAISEGYSPEFTDPPNNYTFAVAILEGKPVFIGGVLYHKLTGISFDVTDDVTVDSAKHSWNKPKRTFKLAGRELPLPSKTVTQCNAYAGSAPYYFDDPADRYAFEDALNTIIHEAIENARLQNK